MKQFIFAVVILFSLYAGVNANSFLKTQAMNLWNSCKTRIVPLDTPLQFLFWMLSAWVGYTFVYLVVGALFEFTNPIPKTPKRMASIKKEIWLGIWAMLANVSFTMFWLAYVEPKLWTYGWFETHDYTLKDFLINVIIYFFWMVNFSHF